jgi:AraC-like DNA-binding protein
MSARLNRIKDWRELARQAKWSASTLARLCGVSDDTLRRHFRKYMQQTIRNWLNEEKHREAKELLQDGFSVKEAALYVGYKQQTNFTRKFKSLSGICPSQCQTDQFHSTDCAKMINIAEK